MYGYLSSCVNGDLQAQLLNTASRAGLKQIWHFLMLTVCLYRLLLGSTGVVANVG